jgi:transmembrane sensor
MDSERLARFLAGEASSDERAEVDAWAAADPANQAELTNLEMVWSTPRPGQPWDVDRAWAAVSRRLDPEIADQTGSELEIIPLRRSLQTPLRWAAAAVVLLAAGTGFWYWQSGRPTEYLTGVGERRSVTLPDGSEVILAPASRLSVGPGYGKAARPLSLEGRAWFVVTHDVNRPFRVATANAVIEDLGTEFEVNAAGGLVHVVVAAGAVAIHRDGAPPLTLGAGDLATVGLQGEPQVRHAMAVDRLTSWRGGTLDFVDRPLREVAAELERWYDVDFEFPDEVGDERFNGQVPTDRLEVALETINGALDLAQSRTGRTIALTRKDSR